MSTSVKKESPFWTSEGEDEVLLCYRFQDSYSQYTHIYILYIYIYIYIYIFVVVLQAIISRHIFKTYLTSYENKSETGLIRLQISDVSFKNYTGFK